jgi:multiple sugar transport system ATP-binding protein
VAGFIGSPKMNFIEGRVLALSAAGALVGFPGGGQQLAAVETATLALDEAVTLGVRPEHLGLAATPGQALLQARYTALELLGDFSYLYASSDASADALILRVPDNVQCAAGSVIGVAAEAHRCHLFRADGSAVTRLAQPSTSVSASTATAAGAAR